MIFTGSTYKKVSLYLIIAAASVFLLLVVLGMVEYRESERELQQELSSLFQYSIQEQVRLNMEGELVAMYPMINNPSSEKGKIKTQTVITEDTTITKEVKVGGDTRLELFKDSQTYLLLYKRLQPQELQQIFDSELQENGLKTTSVILIRHGNNIQTSGDTTRLASYYRVPPVIGGVFDEITYEGFVHYAPSVVLRWMPKRAIMALLFLEIVLLGAITYVVIEKRKIKPDKIVRKGQYYYLGKTIFDTRKCELIGELRSYLKEVDCAFNVVTKKGDDHYQLKFIFPSSPSSTARR
ncbi:MAG: hypothetical protein QM305_08665 [Bacteroidota bacterium]|nr:hypothetical protein [Bacteroidota bacterium]